MKTLSVSTVFGFAAAFVLPVAIDMVVRGIVLCLAVMFAAVCLRRASASVRFGNWMALMTGLLLLPVGLIMLPKWEVLPQWAAMMISVEDSAVWESATMSHRDAVSVGGDRLSVAAGGINNRQDVPGIRSGESVPREPDSRSGSLSNPSSAVVDPPAGVIEDKRPESATPLTPRRASERPMHRESLEAATVPDTLVTADPRERSNDSEPVVVETVGESEPNQLHEDKATLSANGSQAATQTRLESQETQQRHATWTAWVFALWLTGVLSIALRLLIGQAKAMRLTGYKRLDSETWQQRFVAAGNRLGLQTQSKDGKSRITLWRSNDRIVPMTWGIWRPKIMLPADVDSWEHARLEAVLLHELAHIKRHDCLWQWMAHLATAVYWINPLVWFASVRMRADRECACDDVVLSAGMSGVDYAKHLVAVSSEYPASKWSSPLAIAMARRSGFEERVVSLLDSGRSRRPISLTVGSLLSVILLGLVLPLSIVVSSTEAAGRKQVKTNPNKTQATDVSAAANTRSPNKKEKAQRAENTSAGTTDKATATPAVAASELSYTVTPKVHRLKRNGGLWCKAELTNNSKQPITVYWGDYAFPDMYRFQITSESGRNIPNVRYWPPITGVPTAARSKDMHRVEPGKSITYDMLLTTLPGANCQTTFFDEPGKYSIRPSLKLVTHSVIDEANSSVRRIPDAWTGELATKPFTITVGELGADLVPNIKEGLAGRVQVTGRVVTHGAKPVASAIVRVSHRRPSQGSIDGFYTQMIGQTQTDAAGRFSFKRLPESSPAFPVEAWHPDHPMSAETVANDAKSVLWQASPMKRR